MNIEELLSRADQLRIAVIGDYIQDKYINGTVDRISPEAPVVIVKQKEIITNPGGAANVVANLQGLGCQVSFFYNAKHIPVKTRVMSGSHHIVRIDEELEPEWMRWDDVDIGLDYGILHQKFNCVVISDYGKGMISEEVAKEVIERCCMQGIPVVVDSKYNLDKFEDATVLKCNLNEWNPEEYLKSNIVDNLVITLGAKGMRYWGSYGGCELRGNMPGYEVDIYDTCGAGDTVTAVLAVMTALGEPIDKSCELANIAGSEVCRHPGVFPITKELLIKRYNEVNLK